MVNPKERKTFLTFSAGAFAVAMDSKKLEARDHKTDIHVPSPIKSMSWMSQIAPVDISMRVAFCICQPQVCQQTHYEGEHSWGHIATP
jgi:hypothetical protein